MQATIRLLSERKGKNFFLTSPLIGLIELFRSIYVPGKLTYNVRTLSELLRGIRRAR